MIDEILSQPIATKADIEQLAFWCLDLAKNNEIIAEENRTWINRVVELERKVEFFRTQYLIVVGSGFGYKYE